MCWPTLLLSLGSSLKANPRFGAASSLESSLAFPTGQNIFRETDCKKPTCPTNGMVVWQIKGITKEIKSYLLPSSTLSSPLKANQLFEKLLLVQIPRWDGLSKTIENMEYLKVHWLLADGVSMIKQGCDRLLLQFETCLPLRSGIKKYHSSKLC